MSTFQYPIHKKARMNGEREGIFDATVTGLNRLIISLAHQGIDPDREVRGERDG